MKKIKITLFAATIILLCACSENSPKYKDPSQPVEVRVKDLLGRMTLEEKIAQMRENFLSGYLSDNVADTVKIASMLGEISYGAIIGFGQNVDELALGLSVAKRYVAEKTRLGIPMPGTTEALHGLQHSGATIFPHSMALGAMFNTELAGRVFNMIATECKAVGIDQVLSPDLDLARELRWGRVEETYGEDPYLVGRMGVAYVKAYNNNGIITTLKHFTAHGTPSGGLNLASVAGGERELRSIYLKPFADVIREANPYSIMNAYSAYDGVPLAASVHIMEDILRGELDFKGFISSDWGSVGMLHSFHHTAADNAEAARQSVLAGVDMEVSGNCYAELDNLVKNGALKESDIDKCVARILTAKFAMGLFENPNIPDPEKMKNAIHTPQAVELALEAAREAAVLVQNKGNILPLDVNKLRSIAVIGPNAAQVQFGDYTWVTGNAYGVTPLQGIENLVKSRIKINYAKGCDIHSQDRSGFLAAIAAARASDVAVIFVGAASSQPGFPVPNPVSGESFDLSDIALTGAQEELVKAVKSTGKPVIVVLVAGKPSAMPWVKENCEGVIVQWYAGEQEGRAIAEVLFGEVNPSGRLNVSFPQSTGHLPVFYNHYPNDRKNYVFSSPAPVWAFGHGLSYTTFEYVSMNVSKNELSAAETCRIEVEVRNAGARDGKEVVQLYVNDVVSSVLTPVKELKRFEKVFIKAGETVKITFDLPMKELSLWNAVMKEVVEPGEFELQVGAASDNIFLTKIITVK